MENVFETLIRDVRRERTFILLLSLTDEAILKQSRFMDKEIDVIISLALEKLQRREILRET